MFLLPSIHEHFLILYSFQSFTTLFIANLHERGKGTENYNR